MTEIRKTSIAIKTCLKLRIPASILLTVSNSGVESADPTQVLPTVIFSQVMSHWKKKKKKQIRRKHFRRTKFNFQKSKISHNEIFIKIECKGIKIFKRTWEIMEISDILTSWVSEYIAPIVVNKKLTLFLNLYEMVRSKRINLWLQISNPRSIAPHVGQLGDDQVWTQLWQEIKESTWDWAS